VTRHRRPVKARTRGPTPADPRHRRDIEPDSVAVPAAASQSFTPRPDQMETDRIAAQQSHETDSGDGNRGT